MPEQLNLECTKTLKPIIKYRGGKSKEILQIKDFIPNFSGKYIEPFFGGGAMFFYLKPESAIINDINTRLMNFYTAVKNDFITLKSELTELGQKYTQNRHSFEQLKKQHPSDRVLDKNEELYYELRNMYNGITPSNYLDATLYYYINKTSYSGMIRYNAQGEYNVPYGRYKNFNANLLTEDHHNLLQNAEIYNQDYHVIFDLVQDNDFVFLDPPYDCAFSDYGNKEYPDGFNEDCHRQLAESFLRLKCKSLMVIGSTPLTRSLYEGHIVKRYNKNYSVNIRNRFQAEAIHMIVTNF